MWLQKISILPPQKGLEIPERGVGGSQRPKNLSKRMKLDQNFQRGGGGGGVLAKTPSVEAVGVWKIFGTTQSSFLRIGHVPCK